MLFAREFQAEMVKDHLTRRQLASRHGVSADRMTQWLCLLKLPLERLRTIEALGDHWDKQVITERAKNIPASLSPKGSVRGMHQIDSK